jgi:primosomal protein N' (replication factor Y)
LPIPLQRLFTYEISKEESLFLQTGMRVAVPFGKSKLYTGIVFQVHQNAPVSYEAKEIHQILDEIPIVSVDQIKLWQWIAEYYMCTVGDVMRAALPSALLLQSESKIVLNRDFKDEKSLTDKEFLIFEALQFHEMLDLEKISAILSRKTVLPIVKSLLEKKVIMVHEILYEKYIPKLTKYLRLNENFKKEESWGSLLDNLKAGKQEEALMYYFQEKAATRKPISFTPFLKKYQISHAVAKALADKEIFEIFTVQEDRLKMGNSSHFIPELNEVQKKAYEEIKEFFLTKDSVLLHGVTGGGKTEIYMHLIKEQLDKGKQVLYLVPEIALTTQLLERLKLYFGEQITVYHSRYNLNEKVEVWQNIIQNKSNARLIVGARSSVLLPLQDLGLIIVDEEHETSYKQYEPVPRYHARDTAIVLAKQKNAKILLGTATPSIESYFNTNNQKYGLVNLQERFGNAKMPIIELVNLQIAKKKKEINGHFSFALIEAIQQALDQKEQIILFQNRRGYAPVVECTSCGVSPQCPHCDVSLTYHKGKNELRCHYCGFISPMPEACPACQNPTLNPIGFGTEQIEDELKVLFPKHEIARMDFDTTRGKDAYFNIISGFQAQEIDILVGTQMLSKGLDFSNVSLVGVINADTMLNFPDFRAHERSFQMLVQVSGRAGRSEKQGKVIIQTFNPAHPILKWVVDVNYTQLFENQLKERWTFQYPPYYRIIRISLKHKNFHTLTMASDWLSVSMKNYFMENVLGPIDPVIGRIRNLYIKDILLKIPPKQSVIQTKITLQKIKNHFQNIAEFRSVRFVVDVDAY